MDKAESIAEVMQLRAEEGVLIMDELGLFDSRSEVVYRVIEASKVETDHAH